MSATEFIEEFFTREQATHFLKFSVRTLNRRVADRTGPLRIKVGQKIFYRKSKLIEWLISHERK